MLRKYFIITGSIFLLLLLLIILAKAFLNKDAIEVEEGQSSIESSKIEVSGDEMNMEETKTNENHLKISSTDFTENQSIPSKFTCDGENINPSLNIENIPENAKSLALIVDDPDAPAKTWVHWVLYNIPLGTESIKEGEVPDNSNKGINDFGKLEYGGPCPPSGTHRYYFKIYALDIDLDESDGLSKDEILNKISGHVIEESELIGLYSRD